MRKIFFLSILAFVSLGIVIVYQSFVFQDQELHVVFCDVGQGDAILIRTPDDLDILVDGGPNDSVLSCLAKHMPFWDKTLELIILTHPHADHLNGLISVVKNYKIIDLATENIKNKTQGFAKLMDMIGNEENIKIRYIYAGDKFKLKDGVVVEIVGPSKEYLQLTSPGGDIRESGEFASVLSLIKYKEFEILLTGDSQASGLEEAIRSGVGDIDVLQAPHHGSKTGLNNEILDALRPELAVISVGAKNKYNHPNPFTTQLLKDKRIKILRTDQRGAIEIISDGERWGVNN